MNREEIIQNVSKMQKRITDLRDMLIDGVPSHMEKNIRSRIRMLNELIISEQEILYGDE